MSFFVDVVTEDSFYENLTLGVTKILENTPCVKNVQLERRSGCDRTVISNWEQRHCCLLTEDLRNFYMSTDGFLLTWDFEIAGEEFPVGKMEIRELNNLKRFILNREQNQKQDQQQQPEQGESSTSNNKQDKNENDKEITNANFQNPRCKLFEMNDLDNNKKVILAYNLKTTTAVDDDEPTIWLYLVNKNLWYKLSDNFLKYFRIMIIHLGLPLWQLSSIGLTIPTNLQQIYNIIGPHLLKTNNNKPNISVSKNLWIDGPINTIDPAIFKTKDNKQKNLLRNTTTNNSNNNSNDKNNKKLAS